MELVVPAGFLLLVFVGVTVAALLLAGVIYLVLVLPFTLWELRRDPWEYKRWEISNRFEDVFWPLYGLCGAAVLGSLIFFSSDADRECGAPEHTWDWGGKAKLWFDNGRPNPVRLRSVDPDGCEVFADAPAQSIILLSVAAGVLEFTVSDETSSVAKAVKLEVDYDPDASVHGNFVYNLDGANQYRQDRRAYGRVP